MKIYSAQLKGTTTVATGSNVSLTGSFSGSIAGIDINATNQFTASTSTRLTNIEIISASNINRITSLETKSASVDISISNINAVTSSFSPRVSNLESKSASVDISISNINAVTASNIARLSNLETKSSSVDISITNINSFTASNGNTSLNQLTGSLATTGSNSFFGTQVFSGSVFIANDLVVQGSSSIQYISASSVSIGTNIVQLNTATPSVRFAGLTMIDSGSIGGSGSFLYDSLQDEFIFIHRGNGTNVTSSHFVLGPETYDSLGNETYLTCNLLTKGTGKEHLVDSCIFDNGTTTCIKNNLIGTGTACFTGNTIVSTSGNTTLTINGTSGVPALSFINTGGTNNIYGGVGSVANITLAPGDVNAVKIFAAGCISCFAGNVCAPTFVIGGGGTAQALFIPRTSNSCYGLSIGEQSLYGDHTNIIRTAGSSSEHLFISAGTNASSVSGYIRLGADRDNSVGINIAPKSTLDVATTSVGDNVASILTLSAITNAAYGQCSIIQAFVNDSGNAECSNIGSIQFIKYRPASNCVGGDMVLSTKTPSASGISSPTERMRITSDGAIGIGCATPSYRLDIVDTCTSGVRGLRINTASNSVGPSIVLRYSPGGLINWLVGTSQAVSHALEFVASNALSGDPGASGTTRMILTCGGNLGINTTSPTTKLSVNSGINTSTATVMTLQQATDGTVKDAAGFGLAINNGGQATNAADLIISAASGGSLIERMRINSNGYISIGASSAIAPLAVYVCANTTSVPTVQFVSRCGDGSAVFTTIGGSDSWHGIALRGVPACASDWSITAGNQMSFFEYGSDFRFYLKQPASMALHVQFLNGTIYAVSTSISAISDIRLKENIRTIGYGLNEIIQLKPKMFDWKAGHGNCTKDNLGFIAQDVETILPELVTEWSHTEGVEAYKTLKMGDMIPVLTKAMQEQQCIICSQASMINILKSCIGIV